MKAYTVRELVDMTMTGQEQFYLAHEVDAVLKSQATAAISGMNAAKAVSSGQLREAHRLNRESSPDALESERAANAVLTAENDRLRKALDHIIAVYQSYYYGDCQFPAPGAYQALVKAINLVRPDQPSADPRP